MLIRVGLVVFGGAAPCRARGAVLSPAAVDAPLEPIMKDERMGTILLTLTPGQLAAEARGGRW